MNGETRPQVEAGMRLLKMKEVAERLRSSLSNAYALVESGELIAVAVGAGKKGLRVSEARLAEFLARRETGNLEGLNA